MTDIIFPPTPSIDQVFEHWVWDGEAWVPVSTYATEDFVEDRILPLAVTTLGISGLEFRWVSGTNFSVIAGVAASDDGQGFITLPAHTNVALASLLDTGAVTANTWYYCFAIDDGTAPQLLVSTSPITPTMPSGYSRKRRIFALLVNETGNIHNMVQHGDLFLWDVPRQDVFAANYPAGYTAGPITIQVSAPSILVETIISIAVGGAAFVFSPLFANVVVNKTLFQPGDMVTSISQPMPYLRILTATGQIRLDGGAVTNIMVSILNRGWVDRRGIG